MRLDWHELTKAEREGLIARVRAVSQSEYLADRAKQIWGALADLLETLEEQRWHSSR